MICVVMGAFLGFEYWRHRFDRPWAYGKENLLGKWEGSFVDPNGVTKQLTMEIFEPEEERWDASTYVPQDYPESQEFKGTAQVKSKLGVENDHVRGLLGTKDGHQIDRIDFTPKDESKHILESFNLSNTAPGGVWEGDEIKVSVEFAYRTKTGSAFWDSSDPKYRQKVLMILHRVQGQ
ncbi:hypothetical protein [Dyadobacter luticola]|uniref:Uncharacterized protein n=1 Tax=Dyadobacter luticola TaxID=1979387 RepID=A0A5R9L5L0_9BACT|nr:hypothetical protein [Dyadobacter luticola]TLV03862.1 hypothetical protein FEN17_09785 [Dyadobacter luticola]